MWSSQRWSVNFHSFRADHIVISFLRVQDGKEERVPLQQRDLANATSARWSSSAPTVMKPCWQYGPWCMRAESLSSSDFLQPHGLEPARILCPWDSPGKNTEVGAMPSSRGSSPMGSNLCLLHLLHCQVDSLPRSLIRCFPGISDGKESACNAGDLGSIPGPGRSPGEGNGYLLQYSCLENSTNRGAWQTTVHGVPKSRTWLSN